MISVVQRVAQATVSVEGEVHGSIKEGLIVYLGVKKSDTVSDASYIAKKIANLRIFVDEKGKMNRSVMDISGGVLLISQFTLCANTKKGNRPSFNDAMNPDGAVGLYEQVKTELESYDLPVETGVFGAHMMVDYINDGPVTILLDSDM